MLKLIGAFALVLPFVIGCASNAEFAKKLTPAEYVFNDADSLSTDVDGSIATIGAYANRYSGYVPDSDAKERVKFDAEYPVYQYSEKNLEAISGMSYRHRLGQVLRLSADLDTRTSGFAKDENGRPYSVSGMIESITGLDSNLAISSGVSQAVVASANPSAAISPGSSASTNAGLGLLAGFLAGGIHQLQAESAIKGIISKNTFGERMEETTFSGAAPSARSLARYGVFTQKLDFVKISPLAVKAIMVVAGERDLKYKRRHTLLTAVGTYRGENYRAKYPTTEGWEFRITNINTIRISDADLEDSERLHKAIRAELSVAGVKL